MTRDRPAGLEMSQDREAGRGRREVLERMPAHKMGGRIDRTVKVLIERRGNAGVFRRKQQEHHRQCDARKKLHPAIEPQIATPAPQQQAEHAESQTAATAEPLPLWRSRAPRPYWRGLP